MSYPESETLRYSTVGSMAAEFADATADVSTEEWLPHKPI